MLKPLLWLFSWGVVLSVILFWADQTFPEFEPFVKSLNIVEVYALAVLVVGTSSFIWMKLYERLVER